MSDPGSGTGGKLPSAEELRMAMLEAELARMEAETKARAAEEKKHAELAEQFLKGGVSQAELEMIRRLVVNAVKAGKTEVLVYSFPSKLCSDHGRAINNNDPAWPTTLQGKAKELFDRYEANARPLGYRLKAMIVSFPDGVPGDVGLFLNWAAPIK